MYYGLAAVFGGELAVGETIGFVSEQCFSNLAMAFETENFIINVQYVKNVEHA